MTYAVLLELQAGASSAKYQRSLKDLYRYSNMLWGETADASWEKTVEQKYPLGTVIPKGRVAGIKDFGVFVELESGINGLLPKQELAWCGFLGETNKLEEGHEVEVVIREIKSQDRQIRLGFPNSYDGPEKRYQIDGSYTGTVVRFTPTGIVVELEPGLTGLVHISEMWGYVKDVSEMASIGEALTVKVVKIDPDQRRINLSMKLPEHNPYNRIHVGDVRDGKVTGTKDFGVFVSIGWGLSGLLHKSVLGSKGPYSTGDIVKVVITGIDEKAKRIGLRLA